MLFYNQFIFFTVEDESWQSRRDLYRSPNAGRRRQERVRRELPAQPGTRIPYLERGRNGKGGRFLRAQRSGHRESLTRRHQGIRPHEVPWGTGSMKRNRIRSTLLPSGYAPVTPTGYVSPSTRAASSARSSRLGAAINCTPIGSPSKRPQGAATTGNQVSVHRP